jgi:putative hemolysin
LAAAGTPRVDHRAKEVRMTLAVWLFIGAMVLLNAFFAAYEIALASVSAARLKSLADEHRPGARAAVAMKGNMEASLAVVQLGITLVGAIAAATGGAGAEESLAPIIEQRLTVSPLLADVLSLTLIVVPLSAVTIVVGELIPKVFALKNKEWVCLKLSPPMQLMSLVFYPAVWVLEGVVRAMLAWGERRWKPRLDHRSETSEMQELRAVVALARTSRLIGGQEEKIILGAARLSDRRIAEIMIPVAEMVTLDLQQSMAESLVVAHSEMHTRFPVCARPGDKQSICGYVNFKDIVSELKISPHEPSLRGILRSMLDLNDEMSIAASLDRMIRGHVHISLLRDRQHQIVGMVTLEDILEELVGDIQDEYDRVPSHFAESGTGWVMGGGVTVDRVEQLLQVTLDRGGAAAESRNLSDWVRAKLDRAVHGGDILHDSGLRVLVRKVRRQKVLEAQVSREETKPQPAASDGARDPQTAPPG